MSQGSSNISQGVGKKSESPVVLETCAHNADWVRQDW